MVLLEHECLRPSHLPCADISNNSSSSFSGMQHLSMPMLSTSPGPSVLALARFASVLVLGGVSLFCISRGLSSYIGLGEGRWYQLCNIHRRQREQLH